MGENLEDLLNQMCEWSGFGTPTIEYLYSDFGGKFDESQWQWVCSLKDLGIPKYKCVANTPPEAVIGTMALIKREDNQVWRKIREEDRGLDELDKCGICGDGGHTAIACTNAKKGKL